jgi:uncharacterized membrane protein
LCYIPLVAIVILFIEENKDEKLKKHIRYWIIMFLIYLILTTFITIIFSSLAFIINGLVVLTYFIISWVLWYKAYSWEDGQVELLDNIENKIKDTFK